MPKYIEMGADIKISAVGILGNRKEVNPMKEIFGIPLNDDEEVCEETLHELGCGCPKCCEEDD